MVTCYPPAVCIDWWYVCYCNEQCYNSESSTQMINRRVYYNWCYADLCSPCGAASYGGDCTV
jgi:hypothetical protein